MSGARFPFRVLPGALVLAMTVAGTDACAPPACEDKLTCPDPGGGSGSGAHGRTGDGGVDATSSSPAGDSCKPQEDCTNGIDDDCNGLVDCADPQCQPGYVCAPAFPAGWLAPVVVYDQSVSSGSAPVAASCMSAYGNDDFDGHYSPNVLPAVCTCGCGPAQGVQCSPPVIQGYFDTQCTNPCTGSAQVTSACTLLCGDATITGIQLTTDAAPSGGSCSPAVTQQVAPWDPLTGWFGTGRVCGTGRTSYSSGGCAAGEVCVEAPPSTFGGKVCLYQMGQQSCPATGYTVKHTYYTGGTDSRGCGGAATCTCGDPTGANCTSAVNLYSNACGTTATPVTTTCQGLARYGGPHASGTASASGGSCAPGGSVAPTGGVTPTGESTICCEP